MWNLGCPLCGVWMKPGAVRGVPAEPIKDWYQEIRAVHGSCESPLSPTILSGVGFVKYGSRWPHFDYKNFRIWVPVDSLDSYSNDGVALKRFHSYLNSRGSCVYTVHESCWKIFLQRVSGHATNPDQAAKYLFQLLYSHFVDQFEYATLCEDLGDIKAFQEIGWDLHLLMQGRLQIPKEMSWSFVYADPSTDLNVGTLPEPSPFENESPQWPSQHRSSIDVFSRLPPEVIYSLLAVLPSKAVGSLRLASSTVAPLSAPSGLPQAFWQSRFRTGFELEWVPQLTNTPQDGIDWRRLYFQIKTVLALNEAEYFPGLKNRKRIWNAIKPMVKTIQYLHDNDGLLGTVDFSVENDRIPVLDVRPDSMVFGRVVKATECECPGYHESEAISNTHRWSSHELHSKASTLAPNYFDGSCQLGISQVDFGGTTYISGLRVLYPPSASMSENFALGLIIEENETRLELGPGDVLCGLDIAFTFKGIVGVRPIIGSGKISAWVGDIKEKKWSQSLQRPIPEEKQYRVHFTRLVPREGAQIYGFIAGFDVCKMISLGLIEYVTTAAQNSRFPTLDQSSICSPLNAANNYFWRPEMPDTFITSIQTMSSDQKTSEKGLSYMDFGGPKGQRLSSLIWVTAYSNIEDALSGLEFTYASGISALYGERSEFEQTFGIDGPGGERMNKVLVHGFVHSGARLPSYLANEQRGNPFGWYTHEGLGEIEVSTNLGRTCAFSFRQQPQLFDARITTYDCFETKEGECIVGFVTYQSPHTTAFGSFGIATLKGGEL